METPNLDAMFPEKTVYTAERAGQVIAAKAELSALRQRCEDLTGLLGRIVAARKHACDALLNDDRDAMDAASLAFEDALRESRTALRR